MLAAHDPRQLALQERPLAVHIQGPPLHHVGLHDRAALPALRSPMPHLLIGHDDLHLLRTPCLRGHRSMYVRTTRACSVSSTSSHTDPATTTPCPSRADTPQHATLPAPQPGASDQYAGQATNTES
jgi:hypothetical protein